MPSLARPDGVELHWEAVGSGPAVVLVHHIWSFPELYDGLRDELSRDHSFVTFDPRGAGASTRSGPYDLETDAADLEAVATAAGGAAVALAVGYGFNAAMRVAAARPDVIRALVVVAPSAAGVLPREELRRGEGLIASDSVVEMLRQLLATDVRTALRTVLPLADSTLDEDALRRRVDEVAAYVSQEALIGRAGAWADDDLAGGPELGDRLWIAHSDEHLLFPEMAARVSEVLPRAHIERVDAGPISRPELTAKVVRRAAGSAIRASD
jgi:pimeloyl-ACP methyl ester carboxylesterase